jgi:ABC-type uncharacterized transport system permease subunit
MEYGLVRSRALLNTFMMVVRKKVKLTLHYRFDLLAALALSFIPLLAYRSLWTAAYNTGVGDRSVPLELLISYIILGNIIAELFALSFWDDFSWRLREGSVVADLIRPLDFQLMVFFQAVGDTAARIAS